jgi:hypothetical protein
VRKWPPGNTALGRQVLILRCMDGLRSLKAAKGDMKVLHAQQAEKAQPVAVLQQSLVPSSQLNLDPLTGSAEPSCVDRGGEDDCGRG